MTTIQIPRRFNGPPDSGQGGYVSGLVAGLREEPVVTVVLRSPPPLDKPLQVRAGNLYDGPTLLAESRTGGFERDVPQVVSHADAMAASKAYQTNEVFSRCFACGTARPDGLRLEPGPIRAGLVATPWTPDDSLTIDNPLLWAALDCPGGWALSDMQVRPALLGSMTATVYDLPAVGEPCVVVGEEHGDQGRKSYASSAVYGSDDRLLGRAEQIWIRMSPA
ncbi:MULTISPECIES: hypothetical protein [unclassified Nocardia]|uniref:hypothetical protein n=1 Tax=unclassified Nocardia TaxID=2637762 RepID=UPI001CE476A1|nr:MULTISPECIES: hypothetical protein [unclassified Nocardia]